MFVMVISLIFNYGVSFSFSQNDPSIVSDDGRAVKMRFSIRAFLQQVADLSIRRIWLSAHRSW